MFVRNMLTTTEKSKERKETFHLPLLVCLMSNANINIHTDRCAYTRNNDVETCTHNFGPPCFFHYRAYNLAHNDHHHHHHHNSMLHSLVYMNTNDAVADDSTAISFAANSSAAPGVTK